MSHADSNTSCNPTEQTRRAFVAGTAAVLAAAAAASNASAAHADEQAEGGQTDWIGAPQTVSDDQIVETRDCDVLVIGGGLSGLCALTAAAQEGVKALLIEKHSTSRYGGIFHSAIGYQNQLDAGCDLDADELFRDETMKSGPVCDTAHWATWARLSGTVADWELDIMKSHGVECAIPFAAYPEGDYDYSKEAFVTVPGSYTTGWDHFVNEGHEATKWELEALADEACKAGAEILYNTPGRYLEQGEDGHVTGAVAEGPDGCIRINAAKGVIMCTGDFAGNLDMCKALLPSSIAQAMYDCNAYCSYMYPEDQPESGVRLDTGDGHKMCVWAGGAMEDNPVATMGWPSTAEMGLIPYLGVNSIGRRFCNEANAFMMIGRMAYDQPCAAEHGAYFWKIVDSNYAEQTKEMQALCMFGALDSGIEMEIEADVAADSLEELAGGMGVDPEVLKAEVERYNELVEAGQDTDFGKPARYLYPIDTPPFYAKQATQLFIHTMGGVVCTRDLEVCGADGPIEGLYAAGNVVGRRFGAHYEASLPGMSNAFAMVHGYLAGKNAAAR